MFKVILHGCNGKMGQMVTEICKQDKEVKIVAGIDKNGQSTEDYPVFEHINNCLVPADVVIDFSNASATNSLVEWCKDRRIPLVLCTTGLSSEQLKYIEEASDEVAILRSANMSLGINLLAKVLSEVTATLKDAGFDIEIVEKHHNQKVDAPSGTALMLADVMTNAVHFLSHSSELSNDYEYVYDRSKTRQKRSDTEIGISTVRGGTIVGEHDVIFAGTDEVITFSHMAYSKAVFAKGAVQAAKFLIGMPNGIYTMSDVIED